MAFSRFRSSLHSSGGSASDANLSSSGKDKPKFAYDKLKKKHKFRWECLQSTLNLYDHYDDHQGDKLQVKLLTSAERLGQIDG